MRNFQYADARTEAEVLELLSDRPGHTEIIAGGTDLVPLLKKMVVKPDRVVNVMRVKSIQGIDEMEDGGASIGAAVTLDQIENSPGLRKYDGLVQAIRGISSMQLRCQGTIGGELCQRARCWFFRGGHGLLAQSGRLPLEGDNRFHAIFGNGGPAKFVSGSRTAPVLIALGAKVRIAGPAEDEVKILPLADFYRTPRHEQQRETILAPNEFVTHVILPPPGGRSTATYEVRQGAGPDYPLAAAAASLLLLGGVVQEARIVLGQVAPVPWRSPEAERQISGLFVSEATAQAAGEAAVASATPLSGNGYKVQQAKTAVKRTLLAAAGLETGGF